jgi:hypothetical protein
LNDAYRKPIAVHCENMELVINQSLARRIGNLKTENTCINCAMLECAVRFDCEDNEIPAAPQALKEESADSNVTLQVVAPRIVQKIIADKQL